jgi:hypothetical protein
MSQQRTFCRARALGSQPITILEASQLIQQYITSGNSLPQDVADNLSKAAEAMQDNALVKPSKQQVAPGAATAANGSLSKKRKFTSPELEAGNAAAAAEDQQPSMAQDKPKKKKQKKDSKAAETAAAGGGEAATPTPVLGTGGKSKLMQASQQEQTMKAPLAGTEQQMVQEDVGRVNAASTKEKKNKSNKLKHAEIEYGAAAAATPGGVKAASAKEKKNKGRQMKHAETESGGAAAAATPESTKLSKPEKQKKKDKEKQHDKGTGTSGVDSKGGSVKQKSKEKKDKAKT